MDAAGTLNTAPSVSSQYFVSSASYFLGIGDVGIQSIHRSSVLRGQKSVFGSRSDPENKLVDSTSHAHGGLRAAKYI